MTLQQEEQIMREAEHEFFAWMIKRGAIDVLYDIPRLTPKQRKEIWQDLTDARDLLNQAIKECTEEAN